eukprot:365091-Chlamydomonas_euryale.AAC.25
MAAVLNAAPRASAGPVHRPYAGCVDRSKAKRGGERHWWLRVAPSSKSSCRPILTCERLHFDLLFDRGAHVCISTCCLIMARTFAFQPVTSAYLARSKSNAHRLM